MTTLSRAVVALGLVLVCAAAVAVVWSCNDPGAIRGVAIGVGEASAGWTITVATDGSFSERHNRAIAARRGHTAFDPLARLVASLPSLRFRPLARASDTQSIRVRVVGERRTVDASFFETDPEYANVAAAAARLRRAVVAEEAAHRTAEARQLADLRTLQSVTATGFGSLARLVVRSDGSAFVTLTHRLRMAPPPLPEPETYVGSARVSWRALRSFVAARTPQDWDTSYPGMCSDCVVGTLTFAFPHRRVVFERVSVGFVPSEMQEVVEMLERVVGNATWAPEPNPSFARRLAEYRARSRPTPRLFGLTFSGVRPELFR